MTRVVASRNHPHKPTSLEGADIAPQASRVDPLPGRGIHQVAPLGELYRKDGFRRIISGVHTLEALGVEMTLESCTAANRLFIVVNLEDKLVRESCKGSFVKDLLARCQCCLCEDWSDPRVVAEAGKVDQDVAIGIVDGLGTLL